MSMPRHYFQDEGCVLTKSQLRDYNQRVTIFSREHGKLSLTAYGTKRLTSKRVSHLETGNVIRFSWRQEGEYSSLQETELLYAHSGIKSDESKLEVMYLLFLILNRIVPPDEPEELIYASMLAFLKKLQKEELKGQDVEDFLIKTLLRLGFIDKAQAQSPAFDPVNFVEGLIGRKIRL